MLALLIIVLLYNPVSEFCQLWQNIQALKQWSALPKGSTFIPSVHKTLSHLDVSFVLNLLQWYYVALSLHVEDICREQVNRCSSGLFCDFLYESSLCSLRNFGRLATSGKIHPCSKFSPFGDNGSDSWTLVSQRLGNGFVTVSRLKPYFNNVLSSLFWNLFWSQHSAVKMTGNVQSVLLMFRFNMADSNKACVCPV